ncbi:MAG: hypothetical protein ACSLE1_11070 [Sphingobium sp.]
MADPQETADRLRERAVSDGVKLVYFAMGAAASGIAFAFHETSDRVLAWSLLPIGFACLAWGGSFASGIVFCEQGIKLTNADYRASMLLFSGGQLDETGLAKYSKRTKFATRLFYAQMWLLLAGATMYATGHIMHIAYK